jgi:phospholipid/cholesterol/gamma-HCH transport system substrate-binding protein
MDERRLELKVGALLVVALGSGLLLLWLMGEVAFGQSASLEVNFSHTGNVVKGAPVKVGGVIVGKVAGIELKADRRDDAGLPLPVSMKLDVTREALAALRTDAQVMVSSQGPLGEAYLELLLGNAAEPWPAGKAIRGVDSPRFDLVSNKLAHFLEAASKVLEEDPEALSRLVTGVSSLTKTVDGVITENRADARQIAQDLSAAAKDLKVLAALAKKEMEPGGKGTALLDDASAAARTARTDLPELSKRASVALGGIAALSGGFTEADGAKVREAIAKYSAAGEKVDALAARADRLLARMEEGKGTLGGFYKDPQVYEDLRALLSDIKKHPWKMLWKE